MRRILSSLLLLALAATSMVAAQDADDVVDRNRVLSPQRSFEAFVEAVLNEKEDGSSFTREERRARLETYYDFEEFFTWREKEDGRVIQAEERTRLREEMLQLFESRELSESYRKRNVRVMETPTPDWKAGTAEIVVAMRNGVTDEDERFRILMTLDAENLIWRWYASEPLGSNGGGSDATDDERLRDIEERLEEIAAEQQKLAEEKKRLEAELAQLKADRPEQPAQADFSSPKSTAQAVGDALSRSSFEAFLRAHTPNRRDGADTEEVRKRFRDSAARIHAWEVQETTFDPTDAKKSTVRVRVEYDGRDGRETRTLSLSLKQVSGEWLVDEEP